MNSHPIVSSNTLFHITPKREYLLGILENNFRPRWCTEDFTVLEPDIPDFSYTFPMTCFCDLPLSRIGKHLSFYGDTDELGYGIGLTKEWGQKNGLNPVLYIHKDSYLWKEFDKSNLEISKAIQESKEIQNKDLTFNYDLIGGFIALKLFLKPYKGDFEHNGKTHKDVCFYDEREWRFYPKDAIDNLYIRVGKISTEKRQELNNELPESATLEFTPNDIRYIIVKREDEILDMMDDIMKLKGPHYTYDDVRKLQTRIISTEQILADF